MFVALGDLSDLNIDFYSIEASNVNEDFVNEAHELGREVHVWTINEESDMLEMLAYGVDNIITDYDKTLFELIHK
jgi:glycerophosphoryl diester phosphodiesterase